MPVLFNSRHERFAQEFAKGSSAKAAYEAAGYEATGAAIGINAGRLLKNASVKARVDELQAKGAEAAGVTIASIVAELAKIGFSDLRKVVRWQSNVTEVGEDPDTGEPVIRAFNQVVLIDSDKLDDGTAAALSEVSQTKDGAMKIKFHDKLGALDKLGRHLGMFKERVEHSGPGGGPIETETRNDLASLEPEDRDALRAILERRAVKSEGGTSGA